MLTGIRENNVNGTSRATIIERLENQELVALFHEPLNHDFPGTVRVESRFGTIGYLSPSDSATATRIMDAATGFLARINGGTGEHLSARMRLSIVLRAEMPPERQ